MENHFRITHGKLRSRAETALYNKLNPRRNVTAHEQMAMTSFNRACDWSKDKLLDHKTLTVLTEGVFPLEHPNNIKYRVRTETSPLQKRDIYLSHYLPASKRAETTCNEFRKLHLEQTPYTVKKEFVEKTRTIEKELGPAMRYGIRTENERLAKLLNGTIRSIDPEGTQDTHMLFYPCWKDVNKKKWITTKDFDLTTCYYRGKRSRDPWEMVKGGIHIGDSYTDGFEVVGDLSRTRNKDLEVSSKDFLTTVVPNTSVKPKMPPMDSRSVRAGKAIKFFLADQSNKKTYPKTLKQIMNNTDEFAEHDASSLSPKPKIIQIRSGTLDPLKESMLSPKINRMRSELTSQSEKSWSKPGFMATKRIKRAIADRSAVIRQTVESYFDS